MTNTKSLFAILILIASAASEVTLVDEFSERVVRFGFIPRELIKVDSSHQYVEVSGLLIAIWQDTDTANISDTGSSSAKIDLNALWKPLVLQLNTYQKGSAVLQAENGITVYRDGNTIHASTIWARKFEFTCDFSMHWFPNDEHRCSMRMLATSFALPDSRIVSIVSKSSVNIASSLYNGNSEWQLIKFQLRNDSLSSGGVVGFRSFAADFIVRRKPSYYRVIIITPLMVLTALQLLTYIVPLQSGPKISCGVTVMLSFTMFLLLIDKIVPKSADVPTIAYFIAGSMCASAAAIVFNATLLRLHHTVGPEAIVPQRLESFLQKINFCFRSRKDKYDAESLNKSMRMNLREASAIMERTGMFVHIVLVMVLYGVYLGVSYRV